MGGSSSKVSRKLPTKPTASWAGARTPQAQEPVPGPSSQGQRLTGPNSLRNPMASEQKNADEAIQQDAGDPDFMKKLNELGPVKVDHRHRVSSSAGQLNTNMQRILASRNISEAQAASHAPPPNRLLASALFSALEERKHLSSSERTPEALKKLAARYNVDAEVLERLSRSVNTPSEVEGSRKKVVDEEGQERYTVLAGWVDNASSSDSRNKTR